MSTRYWLGSLCGRGSEKENLHWESELARCGVKPARARVCFSSPSRSDRGVGCSWKQQLELFVLTGRCNRVFLQFGSFRLWFCAVPRSVGVVVFPFPGLPEHPGNPSRSLEQQGCSQEGPGALGSSEMGFAVSPNPPARLGLCTGWAGCVWCRSGSQGSFHVGYKNQIFISHGSGR